MDENERDRPKPRLVASNPYHFVDSLTTEQAQALHQLFQREWWTEGRELKAIHAMLANSDLCVGAMERNSDRLVAFARVLSDGVFKALIFDVIVVEAHRGRGLGKRLMDYVLAHPKLAEVKHIELYCLPEMVPFYEQWNFTSELGSLKFLRRG